MLYILFQDSYQCVVIHFLIYVFNCFCLFQEDINSKLITSESIHYSIVWKMSKYLIFFSAFGQFQSIDGILTDCPNFDDGDEANADSGDNDERQMTSAMSTKDFGHAEAHLLEFHHGMHGKKRGRDESLIPQRAEIESPYTSSSASPAAQRLRTTQKEGMQHVHVEDCAGLDDVEEVSGGYGDSSDLDLGDTFGDQTFEDLLQDDSTQGIMRQLSGGW